MASVTASAEPDTTLVPISRMLSSSGAVAAASLRGCSNFSTGSDSPVIEAWPTNRSLAESTRRSAGIMSPADSASTSPGTSWRIGSSTRSCPRSTVAVLLTISLSRSAARFDLPSCQKRSSVESTTMVAMTAVLLRSWVAHETKASTVSSRLNGLR